MDHPNARTGWTKVRLDLSTLETVYMIETDLALVEPYIKRLRATEEWSGANDASGQGPFEADLKHAKHGVALSCMRP